MAKEDIERAVRALAKAIDDGEHNCEVAIEDLGDMSGVSFFIDESAEDGDPITMTVVPFKG